MPIPIEKGMLVRIKDDHESGIWRGLTGPVASVIGPSIRVRTPEGLSGPLTAAQLEISPQLTLLNPHTEENHA